MPHIPVDTSAPLHPACVACLIKKQIDRYPASASREDVLAYMRRLGDMMMTLTDLANGPEIMEAITDIRREVFGEAAAEVEGDYASIKRYFNRFMMDIAESEGIFHTIQASSDPLRVALGYAMTGNFIDFGAMDAVDEDKLRALLASAPDRIPADSPAYLSLKEKLATASSLTLLTDNCGEVVMDKLLVMTLRRLYPDLAITVLFRGAPVLNDVTLEDARQVGFDTVEGVTVLSNGDRLAGTALRRISPEAYAAVTEADLIISKGQGNLETLQGCGLPIYYVFLCKCKLFVDRFGVPVYTGMLLREGDEGKDTP
jgi:uncharacterized protein with ATP-grasp and redox domains